MTGNDYQKLAMRTATGYGQEAENLADAIKSGKYEEADRIIKDMKLKDKMLDGAMGLAGESGEVVDILKKWKYQGHELDKEHIKEELGDVMWYIALIADGLEIPLDEVMKSNTDKLKKRYPDGFSKERSINREN